MPSYCSCPAGYTGEFCQIRNFKFFLFIFSESGKQLVKPNSQYSGTQESVGTTAFGSTSFGINAVASNAYIAITDATTVFIADHITGIGKQLSITGLTTSTPNLAISDSTLVVQQRYQLTVHNIQKTAVTETWRLSNQEFDDVYPSIDMSTGYMAFVTNTSGAYAVQIYKLVNNVWTRQYQIANTYNATFGWSIALSGSLLLVADPFYGYGKTGAIYVFRLEATQATFEQLILGSYGLLQYGLYMKASSKYVLITGTGPLSNSEKGLLEVYENSGTGNLKLVFSYVGSSGGIGFIDFKDMGSYLLIATGIKTTYYVFQLSVPRYTISNEKYTTVATDLKSLALGSSYIYSGITLSTARAIQFSAWCESTMEIVDTRTGLCTVCELGKYKSQADNPRQTSCTSCTSKPTNSEWILNVTQSCSFECTGELVKSDTRCLTCKDFMKSAPSPANSIWIFDPKTKGCAFACEGTFIFNDGGECKNAIFHILGALLFVGGSIATLGVNLFICLYLGRFVKTTSESLVSDMKCAFCHRDCSKDSSFSLAPQDASYHIAGAQVNIGSYNICRPCYRHTRAKRSLVWLGFVPFIVFLVWYILVAAAIRQLWAFILFYLAYIAYAIIFAIYTIFIMLK